MLIHIRNSRTGEITKILTPYSIGDIVKLRNPGCCLTNANVNLLFKLGINFGDEANEYPSLKVDTEYKVIDVKSRYGWEALFLLRDRPGNYVVVSVTKRNTCNMKLHRQAKKEETLSLHLNTLEY